MRVGCRQFGKYQQYPNYGSKFNNSFFPYFSKKWDGLKNSLKNTVIFTEYKQKLKHIFKPIRYRHYSYGSRLGNKLWTRLRLGTTYLNSHNFAIQKTKSPSCMCHFNNETPTHYLLDCFLYTVERQLLFDQVSQLVTNFFQLPKFKKMEILLYGQQNSDHFDINLKIAKYVQTFILQSKRFLKRN